MWGEGIPCSKIMSQSFNKRASLDCELHNYLSFFTSPLNMLQDDSSELELGSSVLPCGRLKWTAVGYFLSPRSFRF